MKHSRRPFAFSLTELLVVIVMVAVVLAIQIPTDAASRRTARRMQNSTQLRGIHQGLVIFAQSNKNCFAGLDSKGNIVANGQDTTGNSGDGDTVEARFWLMFRGDFFTPEYAISPSETNFVTEYSGDPEDPVIWNVGDGRKNYSYALLSIAGDPGNAPVAARGQEWKETLNSQAIVVSDRNTGHNAEDRVQSVHSDEEGDWRGSVLWNDNHVGFEQTHYFTTKYANGALVVDEDGWGADNLFAEDSDSNGDAGRDALMVVAGDSTIHGKE